MVKEIQRNRIASVYYNAQKYTLMYNFIHRNNMPKISLLSYNNKPIKIRLLKSGN